MDTNYKPSHKYAPLKSKKKQLRDLGDSYEECLVAIAQQRCFLPDCDTRPSAKQARIMLQNIAVQQFCALILSYEYN